MFSEKEIRGRSIDFETFYISPPPLHEDDTPSLSPFSFDTLLTDTHLIPHTTLKLAHRLSQLQPKFTIKPPHTLPYPAVLRELKRFEHQVCWSHAADLSYNKIFTSDDEPDLLRDADKIGQMIGEISGDERGIQAPDCEGFLVDGAIHLLNQFVQRAAQGCQVKKREEEEPFWERVKSLGNRSFQEEVEMCRSEYRQALEKSTEQKIIKAHFIRDIFKGYVIKQLKSTKDLNKLQTSFIQEAKELTQGQIMNLPLIPCTYPDLNLDNFSDSTLISSQIRSIFSNVSIKMEKRIFKDTQMTSELANKISQDQELS